jgi:threonine/homoserine/homoserine lactone efflux protein
MTNSVAFAVASLFVLFTPGPTNTLLLASATSVGFRRSLLLPLAEVAGYMTALTVLILGVGPLVRSVPVLAMALKLGCAAYLVLLSVMLWRRVGETSAAGSPITPSRVFIATLLNPKALVFAFLIVPFAFDRDWTKPLPYLGALSLMIAFAGFSWITAGELLGSAVKRESTRGFVQRACAAVLLVFAGTLVVSVTR